MSVIIIQYIRALCKYIERCHHLVVIIHKPSDSKLTAILFINLKCIGNAAVKLRYLLVCQHHILCICDHRADIVYSGRIGKFSGDILVYIRYQPLAVALTAHKLRNALGTVHTSVPFYDL